MTKRKIIIGIIIAATVICIAMTGLLALAIQPYFYGLNQIGGSFDKVYITCTEFRNYSIETVGVDATAYMGERECTINGDLGYYILKVGFDDAEVSEGFYKMYSPWTTYKIENSELSFMYAYDSDHGFDIFIGADKPIEESNIVVIGLRNP
ncbi:MAG: hypothetical protein IJY39_04325 [Clostridia bacterium]|nr:hypothetical protein [Clostridia bacterium]